MVRIYTVDDRREGRELSEFIAAHRMPLLFGFIVVVNALWYLAKFYVWNAIGERYSIFRHERDLLELGRLVLSGEGSSVRLRAGALLGLIVFSLFAVFDIVFSH